MERGIKLHAEQLRDDDGVLHLRMSYPNDPDDSACTWYRAVEPGFVWLDFFESLALEGAYQAMRDET